MAECFRLFFNGVALLPAPLRLTFAALLFATAMLFAKALHDWLVARRATRDADFWAHMPAALAVSLVVLWGSWATLAVCLAFAPDTAVAGTALLQAAAAAPSVAPSVAPPIAAAAPAPAPAVASVAPAPAPHRSAPAKRATPIAVNLKPAVTRVERVETVRPAPIDPADLAVKPAASKPEPFQPAVLDPEADAAPGPAPAPKTAARAAALANMLADATREDEPKIEPLPPPSSPPARRGFGRFGWRRFGR